MNINDFKNSFPKTSRWIHLNNAGMALLAKPAKEKAQYWIDRLQIEGAHAAPELLHSVEQARVSMGALIGCKTKELGFFQSTSGAVSQVAFGMGLKPTDEIITWDQEYPSNSLPWRVAAERTGARLVTVSSNEDLSTPVDSLINAITDRTRVIAISWVQYQTGSVTDLRKLTEVTRARGIWTVVDVIQGLGQLPFDFATSGVDIICGGSHKWLLSLVGVGFIAIREELLQKLIPLDIGTETFVMSTDPARMYHTVKAEASKFESGSKQLVDMSVLGASVEFIRDVSVEAIADEIQKRSSYLREGLLKLGAQIHSANPSASAGAAIAPRTGSIVNFSIGGIAERQLIEALFIKECISYSQRGPGIRLSPHVYTTNEDIDRVLSLLKEQV